MKARADKVAASRAAIAASGIAHLTAQAPGLYLYQKNGFLTVALSIVIAINRVFTKHNAYYCYLLVYIDHLPATDLHKLGATCTRDARDY